MNEVYWNDYMKKDLLDKNFMAANDVIWEAKDQFWIPISRLN